MVGGGAFVVGADRAESEVECEIGGVATMWDGEVARMAGGLAKVRLEKKVLILPDSKAAIAAVRKAGMTGKARSRHLREVVNTIAEVREGGRGSQTRVGESLQVAMRLLMSWQRKLRRKQGL